MFVCILEKNKKEKIERKKKGKKKEIKKIEVSGCQPGWCSVRPPPTNQMKPLSSHGATPANHFLIFSDYNATFSFRLNTATPANHILIFFRYSTDADHIFWFYWNTNIFNLTLLVLIV